MVWVNGLSSGLANCWNDEGGKEGRVDGWDDKSGLGCSSHFTLADCNYVHSSPFDAETNANDRYLTAHDRLAGVDSEQIEEIRLRSSKQIPLHVLELSDSTLALKSPIRFFEAVHNTKDYMLGNYAEDGSMQTRKPSGSHRPERHAIHARNRMAMPLV